MKIKELFVIKHSEIENDGHIIWSSDIHPKFYESKESAQRAIPQISGYSGDEIVWNESKTVAEIENGTKYTDEYEICCVKPSRSTAVYDKHGWNS